ncbi:MAG: aldo/keto reductase [Thermodesulfovibrionales bacterium]|nr:aldo/keto reductase [Thermodesulfovibrionales bacterium]
MNRREFLGAGAVLTVASMMPLDLQAKDDKDNTKPVIKAYKEIGKTGIKMSDISFGAGRAPAASLILRAIDAGINYFDTAPDYGASEKNIGEAMPRIKRDKIYIATKFCTPNPYPSHLPLGSKRADFISSVEQSLSRMKTDYIDFIFVHAIGEMNRDYEKEKKRLFDPEMLSAFEKLKKDGKVRFLAVSSHGPNNTEQLLMDAVKSGKYDMIMPSFNFMKFPKMMDVIKEAYKNKVGVVAMKTLAGAKDSGISDYPQAAFRWVLKHEEVSGLVVSFRTTADLENYLPASGTKYSKRDEHILKTYAKMFSKDYCRTGCNDCSGVCKNGVDIATVLRYRMYFKDYSMEKESMKSYASLDNNASSCLTCEEPTCNRVCPYGLPIKDLLVDAHTSLTFFA